LLIVVMGDEGVVVGVGKSEGGILIMGGTTSGIGEVGIGGREGAGDDGVAVGLVDADDERVDQAELLAGLVQLGLVGGREAMMRRQALGARDGQGGRGAGGRSGREAEPFVVRHTLTP